MAGVRPGEPEPAAGDVQAARRAARPLHAALERDRPATAEGSNLAGRSRLRLASAGQGPARPSPLRADACAHARRDSGVGERRALAELRPAASSRLPSLRDGRRPSLSLGSLLADLERAEQAHLAPAHEAGNLRPAPAQPRVRGDPCRPAPRPRRRRCNGASRRQRGRLTRRLDPRHGARTREARRVRPPPLPRVAVGDAVQRRLQELPVDHDGDDQEAPHPRQARLRVEADLADRVRLPDEPARHLPRRAPQDGRRRCSASPRCARGGCHA